MTLQPSSLGTRRHRRPRRPPGTLTLHYRIQTVRRVLGLNVMNVRIKSNIKERGRDGK
jgi:rRNA maturation endonuclease Nob1